MPKRRTKKTRQRDEKEVVVYAAVSAPGGGSYQYKARIALARNKSVTVLDRCGKTCIYKGRVPPGEYTLKVRARGLQTPARKVRIPRSGKTLSVYLGFRGWPFYRFGENIVPFDPMENFLAIVFPSRSPDTDAARRTVAQLTGLLPLKPVVHDPQRELPFTAANGAIWLFEITVPPSDNVRKDIMDEVDRMFNGRARTGMPVDMNLGQVKVLDNRFVIRFRDHVTPGSIEAIVDEVEGRVLREFLQAGNARYVEFLEGSWRDHLAIVERWLSGGLLMYGEPDIVAEITDGALPVDYPDDPEYAYQANLYLQNAKLAWEYIESNLRPELAHGNPSVLVASVDRGFDRSHPDVGGNLTDGSPQVAHCYDFADLRACTGSYSPDDDHGMRVYGVIAALTNNTTNVAGISPNTQQIALERPDCFDCENYPDTLLWAAGFATGNTSPNWPSEPITPGADIICCAHGSRGLPLSGLMNDTLNFLATYGRGGKGTLVIYSTGNDGALFTNDYTWAGHPKTMAIGGSLVPTVTATEEKHDSSTNFGPEIDMCAVAAALTLNTSGGTVPFFGTSAAAPTVAAAAALMLSVEPTLTWIDLRDILRNTAEKIDAGNNDPDGQYNADGFSWKYGYGRLDILEAVKGADAFDPSEVDLLTRDNLWDDGTFVPTGGVFWQSPDLWDKEH